MGTFSQERKLKENCPTKNWTKTVESDLNQDKNN